MLIRHGVEHAAAGVHFLAAQGGGALCAAVADQHRIALPGLQGQHGRHQVGDKAGATDHGAVQEAWVDAQILGHGHAPHGGGHAGGANAIDVRHFQARIGHGLARRTCQQLHFGEAMGFATTKGADTGNDGAAAQRRQLGAHAWPSFKGSNTTRPLPSVTCTRAFTRWPILTWSGESCSTRDIRRTPSSRSIKETL